MGIVSRVQSDAVGQLYLRCKIEAQVTVVGETVLDQKRYFGAQAELDTGGETGGLAEVDEIFEGEGQGDRFGELDVDILVRLVDVGVAAQSDGSGSDVSVAGELDSLLCALN